MFTKTRCLNLAAACACLLLTAQSGPAQSRPAGREEELLSLIPERAVFFVERRGHEAVREAFLASNLGKMAQDEAILQFVHDSRVRIGKKIVAALFNLKDEQDLARHHKLLHDVLKPFWYNPCAMFVVFDEGHGQPGLGFICVPGEKYRKDCDEALKALMKVGLPPPGKPGTRQAFTCNTGTLVWQGVAKAGEEFTLPAEVEKQGEQLKGRSLFLVNWTVPMLLVTTDLSAARALDAVVAGRGRSKADSRNVKVVMQKTALKDWAFRWHADAEAMLALAAKANDGHLPEPLTVMGLDKVRGLGGTGGYADNVFTRFTYVDAPQAGGLLKVFKPGGSYKKALSMVPSEATFCLAGQLDTKVVLDMVRELLGDRPPHADTAPAAATRPAVKLSDKHAKILRQLELLAEASGGNVGGFVLDIQALMMGMFGAGGPPVAAVMDLTDRDKAAKAVEELVKLAGDGTVPDEEDEETPAPPRATEYRKVPIRYAGEMLRFAVLQDRLVIALGDNALKAAIDSALDKTGGFAPDSQAQRLAALTGDGPAIFMMDLAALAKLAWPMLMQAAEAEPMDLPFTSLPSTNKMVGLLGPEIAVFAPDEGGLLLKSRGKIPFATKAIFGYPMMMFAMMGMF